MTKKIFFPLLLFLAINLNAQSKKELIVILNTRIDSLKTVLLKESEFNTNKISELNLQINNNSSEISVLTNDLNKAKSENNNLNNKIVLLEKDIEAKIIENNNLAQKIKKTNDSLKNDLTEAGLKGKVKFYSESKYKLVEKFGAIEKKSLSDKSTFKYNVKGNMIEWNQYNANGSLSSKSKYDEKGNMIESISYNANGSLFSKQTYKYDEKGNMIEDISYDADDGSLWSKKTYKYDEKGNEIEYNDYNADGSLSSNETNK